MGTTYRLLSPCIGVSWNLCVNCMYEFSVCMDVCMYGFSVHSAEGKNNDNNKVEWY